MGRRTPLYEQHCAAGGRMVEFGGWDLPVGYGSQIEEHHAVRRDAGVFDVSHMCVVDLRGPATQALLARLLANDVGRLTAPGKALYSCMLREDGGVLDDLIAFRLDPDWFRLVVNAATAEKDLEWIGSHAALAGVTVTARRELALLAVQGPKARAKTLPLLPTDCMAAAAELRPFFGQPGGDWFVSRTGYTGEDGFEVALPAAEAPAFWTALVAAGVRPCGLGARDTLRLEAGMNLYGQDMDESVTPLESGLAWTVVLDDARDFIGKAALIEQRHVGPRRRLAGLVLQERGVLRSHQRVVAADGGEGAVTSGTFAPTLERSIGLARFPVATDGMVQVEIRGRLLPARVVKPPFVRNGRILVEF
ncbi:MAG: glycine cleavage system aminomethyltransferase GcvT [Gammaproteobacteria bacterium]|nr:MAG: glycine cleavage system aminomethyltransferase GcvT [Gammaproteobacteria bacterium]